MDLPKIGDSQLRIAVIGAGNVATHLAKAFDSTAWISQLFSHNLQHAQELAAQLRECEAIDNLQQLNPNLDIYIISVADDAISDVVSVLPKLSGIAVHTSGSVSEDVLSVCTDKYGVLYPLQTFSKHVYVEMSEVPFFTEGSSPEALEHIDALASLISRSVHHADSEQRKTLHLAAVFACNFSNHMLDLASDLLNKSGYPLEVLHPLMDVTIKKAFQHTPRKSQTGPAARGDANVMKSHLKMLDSSKEEIYRVLSNSILNNLNKTLRI